MEGVDEHTAPKRRVEHDVGSFGGSPSDQELHMDRDTVRRRRHERRGWRRQHQSQREDRRKEGTWQKKLPCERPTVRHHPHFMFLPPLARSSAAPFPLLAPPTYPSLPILAENSDVLRGGTSCALPLGRAALLNRHGLHRRAITTTTLRAGSAFGLTGTH